MSKRKRIKSMKLVSHRTVFDNSLSASLSKEATATLAWLIEGVLRWRRESEESNKSGHSREASVTTPPNTINPNHPPGDTWTCSTCGYLNEITFRGLSRLSKTGMKYMLRGDFVVFNCDACECADAFRLVGHFVNMDDISESSYAGVRSAVDGQ